MGIKFPDKSHRDIAIVLSGIAQIHQERKEFDKALDLYEESLQVGRETLGENHSEVATLYNIIVTLSNIGEILRQKKRYCKSICLYNNAIKLQRIRYGESSVEVASTLNLIGLIYDQMGDSTMAVKVLQKVLVMKRNVLGEDHLDVSSTLTYLGTILYRKA